MTGFYNLGARATNTRDGSHFKTSLILPFVLKNSISIFPKSFIQKLIGSTIPTKTIYEGAKKLLKKYKLGTIIIDHKNNLV